MHSLVRDIYRAQLLIGVACARFYGKSIVDIAITSGIYIIPVLSVGHDLACEGVRAVCYVVDLEVGLEVIYERNHAVFIRRVLLAIHCNLDG